MTEDQQAWRDWRRVEECIQFGFGRWWLAILAIAFHDWLQSTFGSLGWVVVALAVGGQVAFNHRDDSRRAVDERDSG